MRFAVAIFCSLFALNAHALAIWGGWYGVNQGQAGGVVAISFFTNGEYFIDNHGIQGLDPRGNPGIERGTYTWDEQSGAFTSQTLLDGDGEWGLSHGSPATITVSGNTFLTSDNVFFTRLFDANNPIVGSWVLRDQPNPGDMVVLNFLPDGTYLLGIDPPNVGDLEFGTYTWDQSTGAFSFSVIDTTDPNKGFNGSAISSVTINNGQLRIVSNEGTFSFASVASVPEPSTYAMLGAGLGLFGLLARRRNTARLPAV